MPSDDLFLINPEPPLQWEGLEKRVNRLLESVVQLRTANAELMKENVLIRKQLKEKAEDKDNSSEEFQNLRRQYDQALEDLQKVKQNLERIQTLAKDLKLEDPKSSQEAP